MSDPRPSPLASPPAPPGSLHRDERGLSTMEYSVLFVVLLVGAILAWRTLGERMIAKVGAGTATLAEELTLGTESQREPRLAFGDSAPTATLERSSPMGPGRSASSTATADAETHPTGGVSGFLSRATEAVRDSTLGQYALGAAYGLLQGRTPLGSLVPSPNPSSRAFEIGRGAGELGGGVLQMVAGAGMAGGGGAATLGSVLGAPATLGGSLVVAPAGAAATVAGAAMVATGAASVLDGARTIINAMSMSGDSPPPPRSPPGTGPGTGGMFGSRGTQLTSKTVWKGEKGMRIDVENPNPGQRPGQIHFQQGEAKYMYDPAKKTFSNAPGAVNELLESPEVQRAIEKGLRFLGER